MTIVRLIREVNSPTGFGPGNGQYALQRALRQRIQDGLDGLVLGGAPGPRELPWFWCWEDRAAAVDWARHGAPFVQGPNTLFLNSRWPRCDALERALLDSPSCRLMFTESEWYRQLILRHRGPRNRSPLVLWPYPIDPRPAGPLEPAQWDLLIYAKNGHFPGLVKPLMARYPRGRVIHYGHFRREELWETARRARCCLYLADDDRGPLALAEILLCGCPTIGVPTGAPFVEPGRTGVLLESLSVAGCREAIQQCHALSRDEVAALADTQFDTSRIVDTILHALEAAQSTLHAPP
jgi:hypothetical protein